MNFVAGVCLSLGSSLILSAAFAQNVPAGFVVDTLVASGLSAPHDFCFLPDGRILIANKAGGVVVFAAGSVVTIGTVPAVETSYERGLLSIAADPAFAGNGHFYVYYALAGDDFLHVDRFSCTGALADPVSTNLQFAAGSRRVVLGSLVDNAQTHNGGALRFGPDGMLYLSCGEDGAPCAAQDPLSQSGALLRFQVANLPAGGSLVLPSFASLDPGDNPLSANSDSTQLLLAHGFRNPWRFDIDASSGDIYIADVGEFALEEVSEYVRPAGGPLPLRNFGWPWREGTLPGTGCAGVAPAALVAPIVTVPNGPWRAILTGPRYRSRTAVHDFGGGYDGVLFYADYSAGAVRRLAWNGSWAPAAAVAGQPDGANWATGLDLVTGLRQGPDGALYCTRHPGLLQRIRPIGQGIAITVAGGGGQLVTAGEPFPAALRVRVVDAQSMPIANVPVSFTVSGAAVLTSASPTPTDAQGHAQVTVAALAAIGGPVMVSAATAGAASAAQFGLFVRRLTATSVPGALTVSIVNRSEVVPALVPYVVLVALPGSPSLPLPFGTLCIDPGHALAVVIEDAFGIFGGVSLSGAVAIGDPGLLRVYPLPPGLLAGLQMSFQAVGFDAQDGLFVTNCEQRQF
jgi:glucose/arabinose dehydrogenase